MKRYFITTDVFVFVVYVIFGRLGWRYYYFNVVHYAFTTDNSIYLIEIVLVNELMDIIVD